jgi:hypothetical protein
MTAFTLPASMLTAYNDDFKAFFKDQGKIERLFHMDCNRTDAPGGAFSLWIVEAKPYGCILERNGDNTYFLAECTVRTGRWMTYFAPDPKDALRLIYERAKAWYKLFPLIRAAHAAAHPKYRKEPDLKYLERLITEAFHHFEPYKFISDKVDELREAQQRHLNLPPSQGPR